MSEIVKESGHWYTRDGKPAYTQPNKSKPGETRPTTIRDARKLDLAPSVSGMTKIMAAPGLDVWKQNQLLESAYTNPLPREAINYEDWKAQILLDAEEHAKVAREKGTYKHGELEKALKGEQFDDKIDYQYSAVLNILEEYGLTSAEVAPERSFSAQTPQGLWYGGKVDLPAKNVPFIADFKTTEFTLVDGVPHKKGKKAKLQWPEHIYQLGGYSQGLFPDTPGEDRVCLSIFLSTLDDSVWHYNWSLMEIIKGTDIFNDLVELWYKIKW